MTPRQQITDLVAPTIINQITNNTLSHQAVKMAWEHGGADFQARFDKSTGQAQEMKEGALRIL